MWFPTGSNIISISRCFRDGNTNDYLALIQWVLLCQTQGKALKISVQGLTVYKVPLNREVALNELDTRWRVTNITKITVKNTQTL